MYDKKAISAAQVMQPSMGQTTTKASGQNVSFWEKITYSLTRLQLYSINVYFRKRKKKIGNRSYSRIPGNSILLCGYVVTSLHIVNSNNMFQISYYLSET